jgi:hypothetical protein
LAVRKKYGKAGSAIDGLFRQDTQTNHCNSFTIRLVNIHF